MPRDPGTGIYNYPDGTRGISGQTIYSGRYNTFIDDLSTTMNAPLPVNMGGTGASSAMNARTNLQTEVASAGQLVTNFDTQVWQSGSFVCSTGATAAPTANSFLGTAFLNGTDQNNLVLEAIDIATGLSYMRRKIGGAWQGTAPYWVNDSGSDKVAKAGDTMTGTLTVNQNIWSAITGTTGTYQFGSSGSKYLTFNGADFILTGGQLVTSGNIYSNGAVTVAAPNVTSGNGGATGTYYFGNSGSKYLTYDGTQFLLAGGSLGVGGDITALGNNTAGSVLFGNSGTKYLTYNGTNFVLVGGALIIPAFGINATVNQASPGFSFTNNSTDINGAGLFVQCKNNGSQALAVLNAAASQWTHVFYGNGNAVHSGNLNVTGLVITSSQIQTLVGYQCRAGNGGATSNTFNFFWNGAMQGWVDTTNLGNVSFTSDYRTKKDVEDLPGTWDAVKALRPIKYTQAEYTPEGSQAPLFQTDDVERWGFLAHELQDTLIEHAATGVKDDPVHVQSPNPWTVIAALTKALQEAMARIEALEAA